ncbi:substrate-binding domain-containing protein [Roseovarius atlanticus]|uniref:substrate-binding domain-containing protein n=1 Tax=Roseovarius atlanticus TaxID=1641875 RepID=UPI001C982709|nr:substrate-binding domain-containing protein [Roseovarius atlanticus]MBY5987127.1 substrate-binding domain-containing protein [Roseovarius atlanticus]MBY6125767.1 substrate-binding domain-containing protein [Roseovarius atlanticus]MBY6149772.1 substrate-binding domain-containing protein [Roseovarius atlanticus]
MKMYRAAAFAALFLFAGVFPAHAQDVTLTSRDGDVEITGNLLGFDGEFYRVDTIYGELTVDGSGVDCAGPGCPNLDTYVAEIVFSGAPTIGRLLMPALVEAFAIREGYEMERHTLEDGNLLLAIHDPGEDRVVGEFVFRLTNSDEGFADLIADVADIAMSMREIRPQEVFLGKDAALGDMSAQGRGRVMALEALVPVVAPSNPLRQVTLSELARVLSGQVDNWAGLGGPDAPIALHLFEETSGLGQATEDLVMRPAGVAFAEAITRHRDGATLAEAVAGDPFAMGLTARAEIGNTAALALSGECGFALKATRRAVKTEDYPLTAPMFLYLPARRLPKLGREFLAYLKDPTAQLVIRRAGFVDQAPEEIGIEEQGDRFANAIAQAGEELGLEELQRMVAALTPLKRLTTTFRFEAGSARLDAQSRSNVAQLARAMEVGKYDARRLVFVGFSDGAGPAGNNRRIALRRAEAVRSAVVAAAETANMDRIGMELEAFGEAMPMACDGTGWGRQINRRVEVWVR